MLGKKAVSAENARRGGCYKRSSSNLNMQELFPHKMIGRAGIKKACLSQYVRQCWHDKAVSNENTMRGCHKRSSSNSDKKELFACKLQGGAHIEKACLT